MTTTRKMLLLLVCQAAVAQAQTVFTGGPYNGVATYYGASGDNGYCSYQNNNAGAMPWAQNVVFVAINQQQYQYSATCGMCLQMTATGTGAGGNPLPSYTQIAMVVNECPECPYGNLDQALEGDGAWGITWTPVPCPGIGNTPFQYACQNCNTWFNKILVANHRVPIASVSVNGIPLARSPDNYWITGELSYPASISITSVLGQTVTDTLQPWSDANGAQAGTAQFANPNAAGRRLLGSMLKGGVEAQ